MGTIRSAMGWGGRGIPEQLSVGPPPLTAIDGIATSFSRSRTDVRYWSTRTLSAMLSLGCRVAALSRTASRTLFLRSRCRSSVGSGIAGFAGVGAVIPDFGAPAITSRSNTACGLTVLYLGLLGPDHDMLREWAHGEPSQFESMVERPTCSDCNTFDP